MSTILYTCTHGDVAWMDVVPDEAPLGAAESFAIPAVD
jgi:hypothetical protein